MNTSMIENDKKNKQQYYNNVSQMLNSFMQSQFESTISKFEKASLPSNSPLHSLMNVGISKLEKTTFAPENISSINTTPTKVAEETPIEMVAQPEILEPPQIQSMGGDKDVQSIIQRASQKHGVPVALINAVIKQESNFNPKAVSHAGAQGLMQLMPRTGKAYGCNDPFDAEQNVMAGTKFMGDLLTKYKGDVTLALAGYNAGPGNVAKYGNKVPPFKETQNYVVKVGKYYQANLQAIEKSTSTFAKTETNVGNQS
ncbi:hypothetical protein BVY03_03665 [bacterium K02(2017)]|nr:hypothetical protein BVY03_03665 [bacterium K02(2017)]